MTTAKKLNPDGFEELVQELVRYEHHNGHPFGPMVQLLAQVAESLQELKEVKTAAEFERVVEKIRTLQDEVRTTFQEYCKRNGTSLEEAIGYLENPENFTQKQWEEVQAIRRKVEEKALLSSSEKKRK